MKFSEFRLPSGSVQRRSPIIERNSKPPSLSALHLSGKALAALLISAQVLTPVAAQTATAAEGSEVPQGTSSGVVRLTPSYNDRLGQAANNADAMAAEAPAPRPPAVAKPYVPSEFERYVKDVMGDDIRRFGTELMTGPASLRESSSQIPPDYLISVGDEVLVTVWGSVDADLRLSVDRGGRIMLPRVGPVMVAGLRYSELNAAIDQRVAQVFRNYKLSTSLGKLRSIRVYMTGFTARPGAYTVSSLATLVNAVMQAGGPSAAGSFRQIELRRGAKTVSQFDFYELLLKGDKSKDLALQAEDVIHIGPVGSQVALTGSVNRPAIFELKPLETLNDLLAMAGGFTAVADRSRLTVETLDARNAQRIHELSLPQQGQQQPRNGDLLRAFSAVASTLPQHKQNKLVRIEGEVVRPGEFILPANSTLMDAIRAAGGLTPNAFLYGAEFSRNSVRVQQEQNYERALRDLETEFTRNSTTQKAVGADALGAQAAALQNSSRLIDRLRAVRPTGRIVLQQAPNAHSLPDLVLEDGDRLLIPAQPTSVGVFGSVFNGGSYLYAAGRSVEHFVGLAGGPTRGADTSSVFVLRANGSVISARQKSSGWLMTGGSLGDIKAEPGDTVFVPEELNKTTFIQEAKDWTQILYQFGLGAAALKTFKN